MAKLLLKKENYIFFFLLLVSCARSPIVKSENEFMPPEVPSYYSRFGEASHLDSRNVGNSTMAQRLQTLVQPKKRVLVLSFWNDTPVKPSDLGEFAANELNRNLFVSQKVVLPTDVKSQFTTEDFVQGEKVRVAQLVREGRRLGVSVLVIGRITKSIFRQTGGDVGLLRKRQSFAAVDVEVKVYDVNTGREMVATGRSGEASSGGMALLDQNSEESIQARAELTKLAIRNAMGWVSADIVKLVDKMGWEGKVAKVTMGKVFINAGRASGLNPGDILKILSSAEDIYDPETGAFLGRSQGKLKGTVEVQEFIGVDGSVAVLHSGGNILEGDSVQLY